MAVLVPFALVNGPNRFFSAFVVRLKKLMENHAFHQFLYMGMTYHP